jgi:hypothetical protein
MLFDINPKMDLSMETFQGSKIYTIDNFYYDPDEVVDLIGKIPKRLHKIESNPTHNGIHFEDFRDIIYIEELESVYFFLSILSGSKPTSYNFVTNVTRFKNNSFNDYKNGYWWPHRDDGYTAIIYLNDNDDSECGTNLYDLLSEEEKIVTDNIPEHYQPWRSKEKYRLLKTLKPKYNRLVFFEAKKFLHGMNISNNTYFDEKFRMNQVLFFESHDD